MIVWLIIGLLAGIISGLIGIGGGILVIPAFTFLLGMSQHQAQGTSLAMLLPPIGALAVWSYWKAGYVVWPVALTAALGFFFGGFIGASFAGNVPDALLRKVFGFALLLIALYMIFR